MLLSTGWEKVQEKFGRSFSQEVKLTCRLQPHRLIPTEPSCKTEEKFVSAWLLMAKYLVHFDE